MHRIKQIVTGSKPYHFRCILISSFYHKNLISLMGNRQFITISNISTYISLFSHNYQAYTTLMVGLWQVCETGHGSLLDAFCQNLKKPYLPEHSCVPTPFTTKPRPLPHLTTPLLSFHIALQKTTQKTIINLDYHDLFILSSLN